MQKYWTASFYLKTQHSACSVSLQVFLHLETLSEQRIKKIKTMPHSVKCIIDMMEIRTIF